jgi:hypothetical protein
MRSAPTQVCLQLASPYILVLAAGKYSWDITLNQVRAIDCKRPKWSDEPLEGTAEDDPGITIKKIVAAIPRHAAETYGSRHRVEGRTEDCPKSSN